MTRSSLLHLLKPLHLLLLLLLPQVHLLPTNSSKFSIGPHLLAHSTLLSPHQICRSTKALLTRPLSRL